MSVSYTCKDLNELTKHFESQEKRYLLESKRSNMTQKEMRFNQGKASAYADVASILRNTTLVPDGPEGIGTKVVMGKVS